ncbi:MAG: hypothetical protein NVS2B12_20900 [Ktedonobacteraceae bacterium]
MKNIFRAFSSQSASSNEQSAVDLNEQDLELVNGAHRDHDCYEDDECYRDYNECDEDYDYERRHRRHRRHHS